MTCKPLYSRDMKVWNVTEGEPRPDVENLPKGRLLNVKQFHMSSSSIYVNNVTTVVSHVAGSAVTSSLNGEFIHLVKNNKFLQTFRYVDYIDFHRAT